MISTAAPLDSRIRIRGVLHEKLCRCHPALHRFKCATCKRVVGWCQGAADNMPLDCNDCWVNAHARGEFR